MSEMLVNNKPWIFDKAVEEFKGHAELYEQRREIVQRLAHVLEELYENKLAIDAENAKARRLIEESIPGSMTSPLGYRKADIEEVRARERAGLFGSRQILGLPGPQSPGEKLAANVATLVDQGDLTPESYQLGSITHYFRYNGNC